MTEEPRLPYIMPRVGETAFPELQVLMLEEEEFPRSYSEWTALWDDRRREVEGDGYKAVFVEVSPAAFVAWLKARRKPASWITLGEFLAAKAGR